MNTYCVYNSDIAKGLGVGALSFLLLSQVVVMAATKCLCCRTALQSGDGNSESILEPLLTYSELDRIPSVNMENTRSHENDWGDDDSSNIDDFDDMEAKV